jgi:hypothetical protein
MEHIKYTEGVDKDPLQLWEIFFLYEKIFAEKTLETNPLLQEESEYKLVKEISFPGEEVVYSSILNNNYSFF